MIPDASGAGELPPSKRFVVFLHLSCAHRFGGQPYLAMVTPTARDGRSLVAHMRLAGREMRRHGQAAAREYLRYVAASEGWEPITKPFWSPTWSRSGNLYEPESDEPFLLRCAKCRGRLNVTAGRLVTAAQRHPGQQAESSALAPYAAPEAQRLFAPTPAGSAVAPSTLHAYLADRGEVVYRIDRHAEELVARDRRAVRKALAGSPRGR